MNYTKNTFIRWVRKDYLIQHHWSDQVKLQKSVKLRPRLSSWLHSPNGDQCREKESKSGLSASRGKNKCKSTFGQIYVLLIMAETPLQIKQQQQRRKHFFSASEKHELVKMDSTSWSSFLSRRMFCQNLDLPNKEVLQLSLFGFLIS